MDVAGAFTLLDFRPEDVRLMAAEMSGELIVFFACGIFGWMGMPGSFQVVNRALMYELMRPGMLRGNCGDEQRVDRVPRVRDIRVDGDAGIISGG